jgi:segregation and condensation protein B
MTTEREELPEEPGRDAAGGGDRGHLDLAEVAARLAARSVPAPADPAVEGGPGVAGAKSGDAERAPEPGDEPEAEPGDSEAERVRDALAETGADGEPGPEPEPELAVAEREMSGAEAYAAVEALLFAADRPVTPAQIGRALPRGVNAKEVRKYLKAIGEELASGERGYELREMAGGWLLVTREQFAPYVARLKKVASARKLSGSALETLAVVAYKQPVTRAEIERIRGVACGEMLRSLMEKRLVRIAGRSEELGSALLYGTTTDFLDHFGLGSISDLPRAAELSRKPSQGTPAVQPLSGGEAPAPGTEPAGVEAGAPAEAPAGEAAPDAGGAAGEPGGEPGAAT